MPRQKVSSKVASAPSTQRSTSSAASSSRKKVASPEQKPNSRSGAPDLGRHLRKRFEERELQEILEVMRENELGENFEFQIAEKKEEAAVPYYMQGNADYNTPENLSKRRQLKNHAWVVEAIKRFWSVFDKDHRNRINKEQYLKVNMNINKALIPNISYEESRNVALEDWENDTHGSDYMDYRQYFDALFEVADLWCDSIDGEDYAVFLRKLFRRITVKIVTMADGSTRRIMPSDRREEDRAMKLTLPEGALRFRFIWIDRNEIVRDVEPSEKDTKTDDVPESQENPSGSNQKSVQLPPLQEEQEEVHVGHGQHVPAESQSQSNPPEVVTENADYPEEATSNEVKVTSSPFDPPPSSISRLRKASSFISTIKTATKRLLPPAVLMTSNYDLSNEDSPFGVDFGLDLLQDEENEGAQAQEYEENNENQVEDQVGEHDVDQENENSSKHTRDASVKSLKREASGADEKTQARSDSRASHNSSEGEKGQQASHGSLPARRSLKSLASKSSIKSNDNATGRESPLLQESGSHSPGPVLTRARAISNAAAAGPSSGRRSLKAMLSGQLTIQTSNNSSRSNTPGLITPTPKKSAFSVAFAATSILMRKLSAQSMTMSEPLTPSMQKHPQVSFPSLEGNLLDPSIKYGSFAEDHQPQHQIQLPQFEVDQDAIMESLQQEATFRGGIYGKNPYKQDFYDLADEEMVEANTNSWCIAITGKPGCGKTTVAKALAAKMGMVYLDPLTLIERAMQGHSTKSAQVFECLAHGGAVSSELKCQLFEEAILSPVVEFKGCVLDDHPCSTAELRGLLALGKPVRVIELDISNEDAFSRIGGRQVDPETWTVQNVNQLKKASEEKKRKAAAAEEGDEDPADAADDQDEGDDEPTENAAGEEEEKPKKRKPVDPDVLLTRLVPRPEDSNEMLQKSVNDYKSLDDDIKLLKQKQESLKLLAAHLSALQPVGDVIQSIELLMDNVPVARPPRRIVVDDADRPDMLQALRVQEAVEGFPREWSKFQDFCPVSFADGKKLVPGDPHYAVDFKGKVFVFEDEQKMTKFIDNPYVFTRESPEVPFLRIAIFGPPLSGKSTQAAALSQKYNLMHIDAQQLVDYHIGSKTSIGNQIISLLSEGQTIPPQLYADMISIAISLAEASEQDSRGWILDGFPVTPEQASALTEKGIVPSFAVELTGTGDNINPRWQSSPRYTSVKVLQQYWKQYDEMLSKTLEIVTTAGSKHASVDCIGTTTQVTGRIVNLIDPLVAKAEDVDFAALSDMEKRYGDAGRFCPVSLVDHKALVLGKEDFAAKYKGYIYLFVDEESKSRFMANPSNYISGEPMEQPPLRVLLQGPEGSFKNTIAEKLSQELGVPHASVENILKAKHTELEKANLPPLPKNEDGSIVDEEVAKAIQDMLQKDPFKLDGMILVGSPTVSATLLQALFKLRIIPERIYNLQTSPEVEVKRMFKPVSNEEIEKIVDEERKAEKQEADDEEDSAEKQKQEAEERQQAIIEKKQALEDQQKEDISKRHDDYTQIAEAVDAFGGENNVTVVTINANEREASILLKLKKDFEKITGKPRQSLFTVPISIPTDVARQLLESGMYRLSKFGRYDPVELNSRREFALPVDFTKAKFSIHRHLLYMFHDEANQKLFEEDPVKYLSQAYRPPHVRPNVLIVGPPKSGKSTLASSLSTETDSVLLSMPGVLAYCAQLPTFLGDEVRRHLHHGLLIDDELCVRALKARIQSRDCLERGWIVDGFPVTEAHQQYLDKHGVHPTTVLQLNLSREETHQRAQRDRQTQSKNEPKLDADDIMDVQYETYEKHAPSIVKAYKHIGVQHGLDACQSRWLLKDQALSIIRKSIHRRQDYFVAKENGRPACVFDTGLTVDHVNSKLSQFGNYCPVSYVSRGELILCPDELDHVVEFKDSFYKISSANDVSSFVHQPNAFTKFSLPPHLPRRLSADEAAAVETSAIQFKGLCPVTFALHTHPKPGSYDGLVEGNRAFMASYADKVFAFASEDAVKAFMKSPWRFVNLRPPRKLPPKKETIEIPALPIVGYLEQTIVGTLIEALVSVGEKKPIYPGRNTVDSALKYMAIHLKAHNPKNDSYLHEKYSRKLQEFVSHCNLIQDTEDAVKKDASAKDTLELVDQYSTIRNEDLSHYIR